MSLAPQQQKYWPLAYQAPSLEQVNDLIKNLPKPVINVTPVNRLVQQNVPAPTTFSWWTQNVQYPKAIPMINPRAPMQVSQTWPASFWTYKTPVPFQTQFLEAGERRDEQKMAQEWVYQPQEQKKSKEWYVVMDRRTELAQQQRQLVPELKKMTDDQIVKKYVTQFPQFQEYFKLPEPEQDPNQQIIEAIRRDYPEAQGMTDQQILMQWNQHQKLTWRDPTAPGGTQNQMDGALKWMPWQTTDTNILWIPKIPRMDPTMKRDKQKDAWAPNVGKMYANIPSSSANILSDIWNMVLDPYDTAVSLLKIARWTVANTIKNTVWLFVDDNEEKYAIWIDRMKRKWGILGKIASIMETDEEMADQVRTALWERYWGTDNIAKTMTEDPMGIVSDIAWIIEWGGTLLKMWGKVWRSTRLAQIWDEIASFGNASDPYALTMAWAGKTTEKIAEAFTTPSKTEWVSVTDRLVWAWNGLDADTVRLMKDNADLIKQLDEWTLSKEALQEKVVKIIDDIADEKSEAGQLYQEAYKDRTTFDAKEIAQDVISWLETQWVKYDPATWKLSFDITNSEMANLTTEAKNALKSRFDDVMETLQGKETLSVEELHNIRKSLNQTKYQDWFQTKKAPGIDKLVNAINNRLKKVPWFQTADKIFSEIITELNQVKKILTTTDPEWKLQMKWTIKSLMSDTWRKKLAVIERYYPEFRRNVEAIIAYDDYLHTRGKHKVGLYSKAWASWVIPWALIGWPVGALIGAVVWTVLHNFVTDPKRFKNRVVKKLGNKVAKKIEAGKALTRIEKARMEFEAERLLAKPQLALEYKPDLKTEKAQVVDTKWVVKWDPGAQTLQKQAIEDWKIVTKTEVNASPIKIPGKKGNLPRQVKETWQENVKEPRNAIKEEWAQARKAEAQRRADIQNAKQEKITAYEKATWPTETNVSKFKKWMITPDGVITETWFNGKRAYYKVEWDGNFQYRYEGKAKQGSPVKVPWPAKVEKELAPWDVSDTKKYDSAEVTSRTIEQDAQAWMENEIAKMWYWDTEAKLAKEVLRIEEMEWNLGRVGRNKVKDKTYKDSEEVKFLSKKERVIEKIQEELWLDANDARDRYDRKAYTARDIWERYQTKQEYSKAPKEVQQTHLSPKEAQSKIRRYFNEKEVPVIFQETITTPRWQEAYGKYHDGAITMVKEPHLTTPDHEAFHAYFDLFTTKNRQQKVLEIVKKKQKIKDPIEAEEWLADNFAEFVAKRQTFTWAIKAFFWDVRNGIKKVFGKEDAVRSLYYDMINKKRPGGDKKIRTNKSAKNQTTGVPYLTTKPLQDIGSEIKGADVTVTHLKNMLWRQYKKQELNQIMEVIRVAEEKWVSKLSKADVQEIMRKEILPLEIEESVRYAEYNRLYRNEYLDETNQYKTYWKTHIYTAPIKTSVSNHFAQPYYFWHTRVEDLSKRTGYNESKWNTARVIEVQSDLFQKWQEAFPRVREKESNIQYSKEYEARLDITNELLKYEEPTPWVNDILKEIDDLYIKIYRNSSDPLKKYDKIVLSESLKKHFSENNKKLMQAIETYNKIISDAEKGIPKEVSQLESYANKWAYRKRMVGQEIIEQVKAGKEKIQFPDWVTIAKIEWHIATSWVKTIDDQLATLDNNVRWSSPYNNAPAGSKERFVALQEVDSDLWWWPWYYWFRQKDLEKIMYGWSANRHFTLQWEKYYLEDLWLQYIDGTLRLHSPWKMRESDFFEMMYDEMDVLSVDDIIENNPNIKANKWLVESWKDVPQQYQTIAKFYETELIPYLQKTFWGDFVFEDGWRWLEIDLKKTFGDQKKLGIPAFQMKDDYNIYKQYLQEEWWVLWWDIIKIAERSNNPLKTIKAEMNDLEIMDQFNTWKSKQETITPSEKFVKDERYTHYYTNNDGSNVYKYRSPEWELLAEVKVKNGKIIDRDSDVDYEFNRARGYNPDDYAPKKPVTESSFKKELISSRLKDTIDFTDERTPWYKDRFYKIAEQTTRNDIQNFLNDWEKKSWYSANAQFNIEKASVTDALNSFYDDVTYYNINRERSTRSRVVDAYMDWFEKNKKPWVPKLSSSKK